jgi:hypothetical protein
VDLSAVLTNRVAVMGWSATAAGEVEQGYANSESESSAGGGLGPVGAAAGAGGQDLGDSRGSGDLVGYSPPTSDSGDLVALTGTTESGGMVLLTSSNSTSEEGEGPVPVPASFPVSPGGQPSGPVSAQQPAQPTGGPGAPSEMPPTPPVEGQQSQVVLPSLPSSNAITPYAVRRAPDRDTVIAEADKALKEVEVGPSSPFTLQARKKFLQQEVDALRNNPSPTPKSLRELAVHTEVFRKAAAESQAPVRPPARPSLSSPGISEVEALQRLYPGMSEDEAKFLVALGQRQEAYQRRAATDPKVAREAAEWQRAVDSADGRKITEKWNAYLAETRAKEDEKFWTVVQLSGEGVQGATILFMPGSAAIFAGVHLAADDPRAAGKAVAEGVTSKVVNVAGEKVFVLVGKGWVKVFGRSAKVAQEVAKKEAAGLAAGSARMEAYRRSIGEIVDIVNPGIAQREGTQVCVPKVLQQILGNRQGAGNILRTMEDVATRQGGYALKDAATYLNKTGLAKGAQYVRKLTTDRLRAEAAKGPVLLNVPGSAGGAHALGVTYNPTTGLYTVHDPLLGVVYTQTAAALEARMLGDAVIGLI